MVVGIDLFEWFYVFVEIGVVVVWLWWFGDCVGVCVCWKCVFVIDVCDGCDVWGVWCGCWCVWFEWWLVDVDCVYVWFL